MRILTIIGTRPQIIKASVVSKQLGLKGIEEVILHTGQHFDANMSQQFIKELTLPMPDINLNINNVGHCVMTGRMMEGIAEAIKKINPDAILVYGDCNSTLAGALAARQEGKKLIHVEAGLRSKNEVMPEELNRIVVDRISNFLFCPTQQAMLNLQKEGFEHLKKRVIFSGDVMMDAAIEYSTIADRKSTIFEENAEFQKGQYALCTFHRAENIYAEKNIKDICSAVEDISKNMQVIIPLHPATRKQLEHFRLKPKVCLIPPIGYLDMNLLIRNARIVITDSGGLQKEAYFFNKFCVTLREETEWSELVDGGYSILAGTQTDRILEAVHQLCENKYIKLHQYYGEGSASKTIARYLVESQ